MTKLEEIIAYKRIELAQKKKLQPMARLEQELKGKPPRRPFREAIAKPGRIGLIAEIKRASPSAGPIQPDADAVEVAKNYAGAGADALSVLTDQKFFSGKLEDLVRVREAVSLPVLRKDFLLEEYQVVEAAAAGADAVLLIVAILNRPMLRKLLGLARDLSLDALVEVHSESEVGIALEVGAGIIGINNRDLKSFQVDLNTTQRLMKGIPGDRVAVSESGIRSKGDVEQVRRWGAGAILVGEELMSAPDVGCRIKELMGW